MTAQYLLDIMLRGGVPMTENVKARVLRDIEEAVASGSVLIVEKDNCPIGFLTYKKKDGKDHVSYCFVYKIFRNSANLLSLRKFFRSRYSDREGVTFRSRKRDRICSVK